MMAFLSALTVWVWVALCIISIIGLYVTAQAWWDKLKEDGE